MKITLQYIDNVCSKYGDFTLTDYLLKTGNEFLIISFAQDGNVKFEGGSVAPEIISQIDFNGLSANVAAAYAQRLDLASTPLEIFMFNRKIFASKNRELQELLVIHEVCHLLEKTKYYEQLDIGLTDMDLRVGLELSNIANMIESQRGGWEDRDHNQRFGAILTNLLRRHNNGKWHVLLGKAMSKNFLSRKSKEFLNVAKQVK